VCEVECNCVVSNSMVVLSTAQRYGDLRLARGSTSSSTYSSGRLEIFINGHWGTVCDDSFGYTDAGVATSVAVKGIPHLLSLESTLHLRQGSESM